MKSMAPSALAIAIALVFSGPVGAAVDKPQVAADRLAATTGAKMSVSAATGTVRFARAPRGKALAHAGAQARDAHAMAFLKANGRAFGLRDAGAELKLQGTHKDKLGDTRVDYQQVHRGVPVFGASLAMHYDAAGDLKAVNGLIVPDIAVDTRPARSAADAGAIALGKVKGDALRVRDSRLVVYREGLLKGVPGANHLAFEIEVGNGRDVREFVYVDARDGKVLDQITGTPDALDRRAYNAGGLTAPGPTYPASPYWVEGQPLPTPSVEANNMIFASGETYDFFRNAFGRDSFDGAGAKMDSIFNRGNSCPNASWNGTFISFCPGLTVDDVTAHEWGHAYTEYTHGLIYAWQSGALNESYSDIWGETVDRINGRQTDTPFTERTGDACSIYGGNPPRTLHVNSPAAISRDFVTGAALFGPTTANVTGPLVLANDGVGVGSDACTALVGFPAGAVALVDRGSCGFIVKVKNAELAGASAVVVANNTTGTINMSGDGVTPIAIPSVSVSQADGNLFKANFPINITLSIPAPTADSVRWLIGEDSTAVGLTGALRDMWNPRCEGNPGKTSDPEYYCATVASNATDQGGVHSNSGVPNHAYALLVDGGTYNGQAIAGIGLTKAAQIYFRAQSVYQHPASDFADHADALEQSCSDLIGHALPDLQTGAVSGQLVTATDCAQVAKAMVAVEMRTPPVACHFEPLLYADAPPLCPAGTTPSNLFASNFDAGDSSVDRWGRGSAGTNPATFIPRDWQLVGNLPDGRAGQAFWAADPTGGSCSLSSPNHAGLITLVSPVISVPKSVADAKATFEHWVATEAGWDGGNLKISVNGGPWTLVSDADYVFNGYNGVIINSGSNPLSNQPGWTGTDGGSLTGSWGRSIVNLAPYAQPGSKVRLSFELGTDECGGSYGWYLDDVNVYTCKKKGK
jgi:Zn-dependent metalloprotease